MTDSVVYHLCRVSSGAVHIYIYIDLCNGDLSLKIKGTVVPMHIMKISGGVEVQLHTVLTLALGEG